ncbi:TetR/AcrR family transcriptional regulator C-terminal domain-containing protein [Corallococcus terminator]|uniref:TetR family transcriptional regulator n=1 Tax=Corallococcus terminator TaxID=2316733 RepID=A0A3A8JHT6_9BACT|nr:TetR/AcrR family transcriptional regulator C-terminal domain-containing protein [Corallococcus terminator]RKG91884.1 TetR family transcriptional regulator [Corallococcus terminator]
MSDPAPRAGLAPTGATPRRGRPRGGSGLTREKVLQTALTLVDRDGTEALSMRKLATVLGVDAMSLYHHVANKDAVLDGVAELFLAAIEPPGPTGDWREDVRALAAAFRHAAVQHPRAAPLVLTRQLKSNQGLAGTESALAILHAAGFPPEEAVHALRSVLAFLVGTLLREVSSGPTFSGQNLGGLAGRRADLKDSGFPHVAWAAPHLAACHHLTEFNFGLELLVAALEQRLSPRRAPSPRAGPRTRKAR